jgi:hypothetical protein
LKLKLKSLFADFRLIKAIEDEKDGRDGPHKDARDEF